MSREFGSCSSGYFHEQIAQAAEDCLLGRDELTKLWGEFLHELSVVAYSIASSEACDSGPDYPIMTTIEKMATLQQRLADIDSYVDTYRAVMRAAVKGMVKE